MAKALGAKVAQAPVKEVGWYDVSLTRMGARDPLFSELPKTFSVFQWHEDTFEIPRAANLIVTSTSLPHQAFRYGDNVYGLQFHLEVTEEMIREWMEAYEEKRDVIITETEMKIETFTRRGVSFLRNFFKQKDAL